MSKTLAAVATVAALAWGAFATDASAQTCRARLAGQGAGQGLFGAGTQNAKIAAQASWEAKAKKSYGIRYAKFEKARASRWDCRSGALQAKCVVTAKPCR